MICTVSNGVKNDLVTFCVKQQLQVSNGKLDILHEN